MPPYFCQAWLVIRGLARFCSFVTWCLFFITVLPCVCLHPFCPPHFFHLHCHFLLLLLVHPCFCLLYKAVCIAAVWFKWKPIFVLLPFVFLVKTAFLRLSFLIYTKASVWFYFCDNMQGSLLSVIAVWTISFSYFGLAVPWLLVARQDCFSLLLQCPVLYSVTEIVLPSN